MYCVIQKNIKTKLTIVIRMHNVTIKNKIMKIIIREKNKFNFEYVLQTNAITIDKLFAIKYNFVDNKKTFRESQMRFYNVKNKRYIHHQITLTI